MRVIEVLGVLLFILLMSGAAAWADDPQTKSNSPEYDIFQQPAPSQRTFSLPIAMRQFRMPKTESQLTNLSGEQVKRLLMNRQTGCYTMRTYIVAREGNSDSTQPVGYQECLPAGRVQVKNADGNVQPGAEDLTDPEQ